MPCHSPKWSCRSERRCLVITGAAPCVLRRGLTPAARLLLRLAILRCVQVERISIQRDLLPVLTLLRLIRPDAEPASHRHAAPLVTDPLSELFRILTPHAHVNPKGLAGVFPIAVLVPPTWSVSHAGVQDRLTRVGELQLRGCSQVAGDRRVVAHDVSSHAALCGVHGLSISRA